VRKRRRGNGSSLCASDACNQEAKALSKIQQTSNHRRRARKYGGSYTSGINAKSVAERDGYKCKLCGVQLDDYQNGYKPNAWSVGHIVPMSQGGDHSWENVQAECVSCNSHKQTKSFGQLNMPWV
jgi:5-methylcytosine-specific restriction endonuclease McrA